MTVGYGATGTVYNAASSSGAVAYPSGITAGQMLLLAAYTFESGGTVLAPAGGFSLVGQSPISSSVQVHVFAKEATGSESGSVALNPDATVDFVAHISRFTKTLDVWDSIAFGTGAEVGSDPEWEVTTSTSVERIAGDMLVAFAQGNGGTSARTWSSETIAGASATAVVNTMRTGINMQGHTSYATAPSTANNAITHISELNTNQAGNGLILRLRDLSTHTDFRGWGRIPIKADS